MSDERVGALSFGKDVFHLFEMEKSLPKKVFLNLKAAREGREKFDPSHADSVAQVLRDWAIEKGATHFTHWFQPLRGAIAEKHDSFFSWDSSHSCRVVEKFSGKDLLKQEPDASSFPNGGLRATHEARGYTTWDITADPFLWKNGGTVTLCIPALFFSWNGFSLDHKIPFLRSDQKMAKAAMRLLGLCKIEASRVFSTLGIEQEYFAIDRDLYLQRSDLLLAGRTIHGARASKGQELEEHYFGPLKDRIVFFMKEFEKRAVELGIPLKTRHNEVAPSQHEVAPLFEPSSVAIDHNLLLMELMQKSAIDFDLAVLFHEKPFAYVNGSGKHCNWSLSTDKGLNLLDPTLAIDAGHGLSFLTLLVAIIRAVHDHAALMRLAIASAGNDHRLGGSEAPPTVLSIYLGEALENLVDAILHEKELTLETVQKIDLQLAHLEPHEVEFSDRNRTSFFAFTGNKFEFRAVGASMHPAFAITVIHAIVSHHLEKILDEIELQKKDQNLSQKELFLLALPILKEHLLVSKGVLFGGNAYTQEWEKEACQRGLPNIRKSFHAFIEMISSQHTEVWDQIFSPQELHSRYEIFVEKYVKTISIEAHLLVEIFRTKILPAALKDQKSRLEAISLLSSLSGFKQPHVIRNVELLAEAIDQAIEMVEEVEKIEVQSIDFGWDAKGKAFAELLVPKMEKARIAIDHLERIMDASLWPVPKYEELFFLV